MMYSFQLHYKTQYGQILQLVALKNNSQVGVYSMEYQEFSNWKLECTEIPDFDAYYYQVYTIDNQQVEKEWGARKVVPPGNKKWVEVYDHWNRVNFPENYLLKPFFYKEKSSYPKLKKPSTSTHIISLKVAVPENAKVVIMGNCKALGNWQVENAVELVETSKGIWQVALNLSKVDFTVQYKFGIQTHGQIALEEGGNRILPLLHKADSLAICNESYYRYSAYQMPKKTGLAIPVFSIRTKNSMGIGEFSDLQLLGDWLVKNGFSLLQILPINDTIAYHNWFDCYPYAAISVYALNPFYISIKDLQVPFTAPEKKEISQISQSLNDLELIDLDAVMEHKWKWIRQTFQKHKKLILTDKSFQKFRKENNDWLPAYSVFCVLRDTYQTADFSLWKEFKKYEKKKVEAFFKSNHTQYEDAMMHAWLQHQLDLQLKKSVEVLHAKGIKVKGDLPIGIFRNSVEAWKEPELFGMDFQAGAPPDDFAVLGQNWEFPTYNWEWMQKDGLLWWKSRFQALEKYFDAMRIDHILGFFRIWRIPQQDVQGIMGYFYPAIPITESEMQERGIRFTYDRFCKPFINMQILQNQFGDKINEVIPFFFNEKNGFFQFKEAFNTQRKLIEFYNQNTDFEEFKPQLLYLLSNVILLTEEQNGHTVYHPRFNFGSVESFHYLDADQQSKLYDLYNDYYFLRQDGMWQQSALEKLPKLLEATDMLICGEDLGLVPKSVPLVMDELAILSLQVQRMTNDDRVFSDPAHAPYLSVVTTGTHDTSTLRQWWNENRELTQFYYNTQLQRWGEAPHEMDASLVEQIIRQHLASPAMLTVIPMQEWLALLPETTHPNKEVERINIPAVFPHYWRYRMHISVEDLLKNKNLTSKINELINESGRS